ncbi:unnamed protein product [Heterobilharzia americana]|nr:unnamed protein product [Heterobilharzia americana]CAH8451274.1 unnamed protein product [Heterobilharzia americana]CAH8455077.1 unnamed protein product [Heterobilharzia americana]
MLLLTVIQSDASTYSKCTKRLELLFRSCFTRSLIVKRCSGLNEAAISSSYDNIEELKKLCDRCIGCEPLFISCSLKRLEKLDRTECSEANVYVNTFRRKLSMK